MARQQRADAIEETDRPRRARRPAGRAARPPRSPPDRTGSARPRCAADQRAAQARDGACRRTRPRRPRSAHARPALRPATPSSPMPTMDSQRRGAAVWAASGLASGMRNILILGGTSEARQLAGRLAGRADLKVTLSLAGRTPARPPSRCRCGSAASAAPRAWRHISPPQHIDVLIDATHPYAATISANAAEAADATGVPLLALPAGLDGGRRRPLDRRRGCRRRVGRARRRAAPGVPRHRPAGGRRLRRRPAAPLSRSAASIRSNRRSRAARRDISSARGPFSEDDERALLTQHRSKSSSPRTAAAQATYGKIAAARALGLEVVMLRRPTLPEVHAVETVEDAVAWLDHVLLLRRGTRRVDQRRRSPGRSITRVAASRR